MSPVREVILLGEYAQVRARLGDFRLQLLLDLPEAVGRAIAPQLRLKVRARLLEGLALAGLRSHPGG